MSITAIDCLRAIHTEIKWYEENHLVSCNNLSEEYRDGFIAGLKQAGYLVYELNKLEYSYRHNEAQETNVT